MENEYSFQLYGLKAKVVFNTHMVKTGLNKPREKEVYDYQTVTYCWIFARGFRNQIYAASGIGICHPGDQWDDVIGRKTACYDAARVLFERDEFTSTPQQWLSLEEYQHEWWAACQRKAHDRPDATDPANLVIALAFA